MVSRDASWQVEAISTCYERLTRTALDLDSPDLLFLRQSLDAAPLTGKCRWWM